MRPAMSDAQTLDYEAPRNKARSSATTFWGLYLSCVVVGLFVLEPVLAHVLWGRPGDSVIGGFVLASVGAVTAVTAVMWLALRRVRRSLSIAVAVTLGLGSFLPGIVAVYLL